MTAVQHGALTLQVHASVLIQLDGQETHSDLPVYEKKVFVAVNYKYISTRFIKGSYQWLIGTVLGLRK